MLEEAEALLDYRTRCLVNAQQTFFAATKGEVE